jgi:aspartate/methionine/tyrosine aminotransferase
MECFDQAGTLPAACVAARIADVTAFHVMALLKRASELQSRGCNIVHMEACEPDFPTAAPVFAAAGEFLTGGHVHYTPALGIPPLRLAVARFYQGRYGLLELDPERVIITAGASGALLLALGILVDPGDERCC